MKMILDKLIEAGVRPLNLRSVDPSRETKQAMGKRNLKNHLPKIIAV